MLDLIICFILKCKLGEIEVTILASCFRVLDVANGANSGIFLKQATYYMLGFVDGITEIYTLGIPRGAYNTLQLHLVDVRNDGILLKQCASDIYIFGS